MPITAEQAWAATDPSQSNEERQRAAEMIMAGVAANDAYLASRPELEQLIAKAQGGQVVAHADLNNEDTGGDLNATDSKEIPTESGPPTVESTVVPGSESVSPATPADTSGGDSGGDTENTSESDTDKLRAQLLKYGITPDV